MSGRKVLIVDDEKLILITTKLVLQSAGYEVRTAGDGEGAIRSAQLDIMMPGIDGWETLSRLKEDARTENIPVIVFTAREHSRGKQLAQEMKAVDYLQKPFEADDLIALVEQHATAGVG
ncbi:MAG: response regulator [Planctomycetota bacterium]|jgi:CheY-like chemotaxis protein